MRASTFNPNAERHKCARCRHGGVWKEQGQPAGNVCKHPEILKKPGLSLGLYFATRLPHRSCPLGGKPDEGEEGLERRPVKGYGGKYVVDCRGNIYRVYASRIRTITPAWNSRGAWVVRLTDDEGKRHEHLVHLIVADAFLPPKPPGYVVRHKNGHRDDPAFHNLEYIRREDLGRMTGHKSRRQPVAKIDWRTQEVVEVYRSARQAAKENYMSYQTIMDRCNGKVKKLIAPDGYIYRWDGARNSVTDGDAPEPRPEPMF